MRGLVLAFDDNYVMPFKVLWHSIMQTNSLPLETPVFILHTQSLSEKSISDISYFAENYKTYFHFIDASDYITQNLPISHHISDATYYRLYMASLIPNWVSTIIYFDTDIVVAKSIKYLFELALNCPIAATDHFSINDAIRLWGSESGQYFQAGVLIVNLETWRSRNLEKTFTKIIEEHTDRILWWDQDVLNIAFENNWQRIPVWFNVSNSVRRYIDKKTIQKETIIYHFDGKGKPWNNLADVKFSEMWYKMYEEVFKKEFNMKLTRRPVYRIIASKIKKCLLK